MGNVRNDQAMIVGLGRRDAYAGASGTGCHARGVNAHVDPIVVRINQAGTLRAALVQVIDVSVSWIAALERESMIRRGRREGKSLDSHTVKKSNRLKKDDGS